jgi:hypothetical protein
LDVFEVWVQTYSPRIGRIGMTRVAAFWHKLSHRKRPFHDAWEAMQTRAEALQARANGIDLELPGYGFHAKGLVVVVDNTKDEEG